MAIELQRADCLSTLIGRNKSNTYSTFSETIASLAIVQLAPARLAESRQRSSGASGGGSGQASRGGRGGSGGGGGSCGCMQERRGQRASNGECTRENGRITRETLDCLHGEHRRSSNQSTSEHHRIHILFLNKCFIDFILLLSMFVFCVCFDRRSSERSDLQHGLTNRYKAAASQQARPRHRRSACLM